MKDPIWDSNQIYNFAKKKINLYDKRATIDNEQGLWHHDKYGDTPKVILDSNQEDKWHDLGADVKRLGLKAYSSAIKDGTTINQYQNIKYYHSFMNPKKIQSKVFNKSKISHQKFLKNPQKYHKNMNEPQSKMDINLDETQKFMTNPKEQAERKLKYDVNSLFMDNHLTKRQKHYVNDIKNNINKIDNYNTKEMFKNIGMSKPKFNNKKHIKDNHKSLNINKHSKFQKKTQVNNRNIERGPQI